MKHSGIDRWRLALRNSLDDVARATGGQDGIIGATALIVHGRVPEAAKGDVGQVELDSSLKRQAGMKGYRTPSWSRMKGLLKRKRAGLAKDRPKPGKPKGMGRR